MRRYVPPAILFIIMAIFTGCTALTAVNATSAGIKLVQATTISDNYVQQVSRQYVEQLDKQNNIAPANSSYTERIDRLTRNFNNQDGINIKVYLTEDANAFATADGSVRVYSGLMDIMTDEELLGIIGHEIGHYINHDTRDAFRSALVTSAVRDGLSSTNGVVGVLSTSQIGALGESLANSGYSRKQESEADDYGYMFLKQYGINPWAMAMAFEKLQQLENRQGTSSPGLKQLFSSHPDLSARARRMAERATKDGYSRPSNHASPNSPGSSSADTSVEWTF